MNNPYLLIGLRKTADIVDDLFARIPADHYDSKPDPERFSIREAIAHIADWEEIFRQRLTICRDTPGGSYRGIDEGELAEERDYASRDAKAEASRFVSERQKTIAFFEALQPDDWVKVGVHSEKGEQSIADQAAMILGHDLYHIEGFVKAL